MKEVAVPGKLAFGRGGRHLQTVLTSGSLYYPERQVRLVEHVSGRIAAGDLMRDYEVAWVQKSLMRRPSTALPRSGSFAGSTRQRSPASNDVG